MTARTLHKIAIIALCGAALGAQEKMPKADVLRDLKAGNDHRVAKRY